MSNNPPSIPFLVVQIAGFFGKWADKSFVITQLPFSAIVIAASPCTEISLLISSMIYAEYCGTKLTKRSYHPNSLLGQIIQAHRLARSTFYEEARIHLRLSLIASGEWYKCPWLWLLILSRSRHESIKVDLALLAMWYCPPYPLRLVRIRPFKRTFPLNGVKLCLSGICLSIRLGI